MSTVTDITNQTALFNTSTSNAAPSDEMGKDQFLQLLVAQLNNQDPMNPMDNEAFVAQLATFSSLEAQLETNSLLESVIMGQNSQTSSSAVNFIGKDVRAMADFVDFDGTNPTAIGFETLSDAEKVTITVKDSNGDVVRKIELDQHDKGNHAYSWDGMNNKGKPVDEGTYNISVSATDADGNNVDTIPVYEGRITGISYENGYPELLIGDHRLTLGDVIEVLEA